MFNLTNVKQHSLCTYLYRCICTMTDTYVAVLSVPVVVEIHSNERSNKLLKISQTPI